MDERPSLMAQPTAFDGFVEESKRFSPICLINFERNRYSVPASFANHRFRLRIHPESLDIVAEGQSVCEHQRFIDRSHKGGAYGKLDHQEVVLELPPKDRTCSGLRLRADELAR